MQFSANGKLMLFGEYLVMKGSKSLAIPLRYKQVAEIQQNDSQLIHWRSFEKGKQWFHCNLTMDFTVFETNDEEKAEVIRMLLRTIFEQKAALFKTGLNFNIHSNFAREWGFGSSSTLISLLSQWSSTDPYNLLEKSFGGSAYDIACATAEKPIIYTASDRCMQKVELDERVNSKLLFVYSGRKQSSRKEIERFNTLNVPKSAVEQMDRIIKRAVVSDSIEAMEKCMNESEKLLEDLLQTKSIKSVLFNDYPHSIKSLGAWGGDFFMASFREEKMAKTYFDNKGYNIHFTYPELIFN